MGIDLEDAKFLAKALKRWGLQSHVFARGGEPSERAKQYENDRNRVEQILNKVHFCNVGDRVLHRERTELGSVVYTVTDVGYLGAIKLEFWDQGSNYVHE